ncbi:tRNA pseudouridine(55) synthase TruB [Spirochaeta africana]|uniref:tRNA pseudouridine synthase B n=1 Tax=Spirochaeta africana (strain ATCC 700263 / DSM 8902 / Z-7692) TaxID=889378 RepID=H9UJA4_SPIAZ|nr:tRNA pseudouridine(55) synthase TruB [Spirochaeta africana]AFG37597.1 tRNA pseudouridine 55 synthase [Spirochaeta africana DSM 8902]
MNPHGLLLLYKPAGVSSFKALAPIKRSLPRRYKLGHTGTLDPFADGLLIAVVGSYTKLADCSHRFLKRYTAEIRFGEQTDTLDPEGEPVRSCPVPALAAEDIEHAFRKFTGTIQQVPPAHSAVHINGRRAYALARAGQEFTIPSREVYIEQISLLHQRDDGITIDVVCGAGTYIRSLARDLALQLGTCGHLISLTRTAIGPFQVADAVAPEAFQGNSHAMTASLQSGEATYTRFTGRPVLQLRPEYAAPFSMGRPLQHEWFSREIPAGTDTVFGVFLPGNEFAGQIRIGDTGLMYDFVTLQRGTTCDSQ